MFSLFSTKTLPEQGVLDQKPWIKGMGLCDRARLLIAMHNQTWRDLTTLDLLVAKDAHLSSPLWGGNFFGPQGFRDFFTNETQVFSPAFISGTPMCGPHANSVTVSWIFNGTFANEFTPEKISPTGKQVRMSGITVMCFCPETMMVTSMRILADGDDMRKQMRGEKEACPSKTGIQKAMLGMKHETKSTVQQGVEKFEHKTHDKNMPAKTECPSKSAPM